MAVTRSTEPVRSCDGTYSAYFVIADISGYTGFLANNDLAHAHGILSELTTLLIEALGAPFRFVELEGDAVFVYALVTEAFLEGVLLKDGGLGLIEHSESYPELGTVRGGVFDLTAAIDRYREQTRFYVSAEDADITIRAQFRVNEQQLWPYFLEADRRLRWQLDAQGIETQAQGRPRMGVGIASHCDHGSYRLNHRIVDFQPCRCVTMQSTPVGRSIKAPPGVGLAAFELTPLGDGGTQLSMRVRLCERGLVNRVKLLVGRRFIEREWTGHSKTLARVLNEDKQRVEGASQTAPSRAEDSAGRYAAQVGK